MNQISAKTIPPLNCNDHNPFMHVFLAHLLAKYMLGIFLTTKTTIYPNLVKKFCTHFSIESNSISSFVNHTLMTINPKILVVKFGISTSPPKSNAKSFPHYSRE